MNCVVHLSEYISKVTATPYDESILTLAKESEGKRALFLAHRTVTHSFPIILDMLGYSSAATTLRAMKADRESLLDAAEIMFGFVDYHHATYHTQSIGMRMIANAIARVTMQAAARLEPEEASYGLIALSKYSGYINKKLVKLVNDSVIATLNLARIM
jgi:hypothetical protein